MINRKGIPLKFTDFFEKIVLILMAIFIFSCLMITKNIGSINFNNEQIRYFNGALKKDKEKLQAKVDFNKDISFVNYDNWLHKCAGKCNLYLYNNTDNFKVLSEKSQEDLLTFSSSLKFKIDNKYYDRLVKYVIFDRNKSTFITNDTESIEFFKSNKDNFIKENGGLYNYIVTKGKWYNISYNSGSAPAAITSLGHLENSSAGFAEAYWFPKNYKYTDEDYEILNDIYKSAKENTKRSIQYEESQIEGLSTTEHDKYVVYIIIWSAIIIAIIIIFYLLGRKRIVNGIINNHITKLIKIAYKKLQTKSIVFKLILFGFFTFIFFLAALHIFYQILYLNRMVTNFILDIIIVLIYFILILPQTFKFARYTDEIIKGTDKIVSGNLSHEICEKGDSNLKKLANNINKLNKGFKVSIDDQIKNERLKSELVANVSHDLKTPLTSIINYTDILLRDDITEEEKHEYTEILNRKSLKLKKLIEDLFEISKITSGKEEAKLENVDVIELLNQSIAEYSDTEIYLDKNLTFTIKPFASKIEMNLDGKKMSRVFENLINNALKYSVSGTRVFVDINDLGNKVQIVFKNTSSEPLDFDNEEVFERFTRGDRARNSKIEGNGLGLAIARSIVELHGGIMYIKFDGDLFKSFIELNKEP